MATRKSTRTARLARWARARQLNHTLPALAVFAVAAYQSYWHTVSVVLAHSTGHAETAYIMPVSVDGLMIVAARYISHSKTRLGRALSVVGFALGMLATLASNVLAADPSVIDRAVAVWPAVALIATAVILHWGNRSPKRPARRVASNVRQLKSAA